MNVIGRRKEDFQGVPIQTIWRQHENDGFNLVYIEVERLDSRERAFVSCSAKNKRRKTRALISQLLHK